MKTVCAALTWSLLDFIHLSYLTIIEPLWILAGLLLMTRLVYEVVQEDF